MKTHDFFKLVPVRTVYLNLKGGRNKPLRKRKDTIIITKPFSPIGQSRTTVLQRVSFTRLNPFIKMVSKVIPVWILLVSFQITPVDLLGHVHGDHDQGGHLVYFVPTLKDAATVADLIFGQVHFT